MIYESENEEILTETYTSSVLQILGNDLPSSRKSNLPILKHFNINLTSLIFTIQKTHQSRNQVIKIQMIFVLPAAK